MSENQPEHETPTDTDPGNMSRQDPAEPKQVDQSTETEPQVDRPVESPAVVVEPAAAPQPELGENDHASGEN